MGMLTQHAPDFINAPELAVAVPGGCSERNGRRRRIGIVLPCYNEAENLPELYERLAAVLAQLPQYDFTMLFIDNASSDGTVAVLRGLVARDPRVEVIVNARNFGHIRSPFHALMQAAGDGVILMCTDLQDPPELIPRFLEAWEAGACVAVAQKQASDESPLFWSLRSLYYRCARAIAEVPLLEHVTGFGLYDRRVIEIMRGYDDPYPYLRGLISEIGLPTSIIPFHQPVRKRGITKNNFITLFDMAMLGITSHSRAPLRLATLGGFLLSACCLLMALLFLVVKLIYWNSLPTGFAPLFIGVFFLGSVQIFLVGLLGEYISAVLCQVRRRAMVIERERISQSPGANTRCGSESASQEPVAP